LKAHLRLEDGAPLQEVKSQDQRCLFKYRRVIITQRL
jgi:hypothetical protein